MFPDTTLPNGEKHDYFGNPFKHVFPNAGNAAKVDKDGKPIEPVQPVLNAKDIAANVGTNLAVSVLLWKTCWDPRSPINILKIMKVI